MADAKTSTLKSRISETAETEINNAFEALNKVLNKHNCRLLYDAEADSVVVAHNDVYCGAEGDEMYAVNNESDIADAIKSGETARTAIDSVEYYYTGMLELDKFFGDVDPLLVEIPAK